MIEIDDELKRCLIKQYNKHINNYKVDCLLDMLKRFYISDICYDISDEELKELCKSFKVDYQSVLKKLKGE